MPTIPTPPADASGGYLVVQYGNGVDLHRQRLHLLPFQLTQFVTGGTSVGPTDSGAHDYAYGPTAPPLGAELGVNDTFAAWAAVMRAFYTSAWSFSVSALYQIVSGTPAQVFPTPVPTAVVGVSGGTAPTGADRAIEAIYSFRTQGGNRARVIMIGTALGNVLPDPAIVTPTTGGNASNQAIVGYLSGANTGIVGHDGHKMNPLAHLTFAVNRRLRRHYGYA